MARFVLKEVTSKDEMPAIVQCEFDGYYQPYHPFAQVLWPVFEPTEKGIADSMAGAVERQWLWHSSDPKSHWYYVVDEASGRIAGGGQWYFHETDPFANGPPQLQAYWWPEGDSRDFNTMLLQQVFGPRHNKMNRPHTLLNLMFVHPDFRRQGVGRMLMKPGLDKANELNIDSFVEASDPGRTLYESCGYRSLYRGECSSDGEKRSNLWKKLEKEMLPVHWWFMWKPAGGIYEEGKTKIPFEVPK